jgi:CBS domain-containing protein
METGISRFCVHNVVTVTRATTIVEAATLMRQHHIGALIVVEETRDGTVPVGVLTDRDIAVEVVAASLSPATMRVGEIVQRPVITIEEDAGYAETVRRMSVSGVRRMPVVDARGALVGIITVDDILRQLASPLLALAELAGRERHFEAGTRK